MFMTKKNLLLVVVAVALAAVYVVWFTNWFRPQTLAIYHTSRVLHRNFRRPQRGDALPTMIFGVSRPVRLTDLKVVPLAAFETNHDVLPVWHLISDSNSAPVKTFIYGQWIGGMRPAIKGVRPEPLKTNVTYRLFLTAEHIKGEHDFELK